MVIYSVEYVCSYATTLSVIQQTFVLHKYFGGWGGKVSIMTYSGV